MIASVCLLLTGWLRTVLPARKALDVNRTPNSSSRSWDSQDITSMLTLLLACPAKLSPISNHLFHQKSLNMTTFLK